MADKFAKLSIDNKTYELPIHQSSVGNPVVDVSTLGQQTGYFTYDPGFKSTASCKSKITYIDAEAGKLLYRGYPIEQLAENHDYLNVCYLLLYGELPASDVLHGFTNDIKYHTMLHQQIYQFFNGFRRDSHPMAIMVGVVGALSAFYHDSLDIKNPEHRNTSALRLIAKMPTIAAMCLKYTRGHPFTYPQNHMSYAENFLNMMFELPTETEPPNPVFVKAIDVILTLHADHEQNASTTTVRVAGSTGANPFACIASGIAALWGPAHGGANEACLNMLESIKHPENLQKYIDKAKDKNDPFRLMGFGHRVYKNYDPRAKVIQKLCHQVLAQSKSDPIFDLARQLEEIALHDEYFIERKLYPNVDFYSGIILKAIGIPKSMFTVIFSVARTVGWIAHWLEMMNDETTSINRPRQLYLGKTKRDI